MNETYVTCPYCSEALDLDDETLAGLDGAAHFECPTCGGVVPTPGAPTVLPATPASPKVQVICQICEEKVALELGELRALQGNSHFECPGCGCPVPVPGGRTVAQPPPPPTSPVTEKAGAVDLLASGTRRTHRNLVILGTVALLLLGGLGAFLALRKGPSAYNTKKVVQEEITNNKFFQDLIASGVATAADLQQIENIQPMGVTFIGTSKNKLTWDEARELAKRTGSHVLTIEPPKTAMREPVLAAVAAAYPELAGTTSWCSEGGEPRVLDGLDVNRVTTLDRRRTALFNWYPVRNDKDRPWVRIKAINPKPKKTFKVDEWLQVKIEYNNPGPNPVIISTRPYTNGKKSAHFVAQGSPLYPVGVGEIETGFSCGGPSFVEEIRVNMDDTVTKQMVATIMFPLDATWEPDPSIIDVEIISVRPPATLSPAKVITIPATTGEKFTLGVTARYKAPEPTKLASNLLLKDANILSPDFLAELSANHAMTWHFDTESRPGYASADGEGEITFDLIGYAPRQAGTYPFKTNIGLFDKQTWATKVLKLYQVTLVTTPAAK